MAWRLQARVCIPLPCLPALTLSSCQLICSLSHSIFWRKICSPAAGKLFLEQLREQGNACTPAVPCWAPGQRGSACLIPPGSISRGFMVGLLFSPGAGRLPSPGTGTSAVAACRTGCQRGELCVHCWNTHRENAALSAAADKRFVCTDSFSRDR